MKKTGFLFLFFLMWAGLASAQTTGFSDTLEVITHAAWKLVSAEGPKDLPLHLEKQVGSTIRFQKDFTYLTSIGDSVAERGIWAIDREKKWLMSVPEGRSTFITKIEKLDAAEWKLSFEVNDQKIWLTMIPSENK